MRRLTLGIGSLICACSAGAHAETLTYGFDAAPDVPASFEVGFAVRYPGTVVVESSWTGGRVLAFRVDPPPGSVAVARRSGPSPQRVTISVDDGAVRAGGTWKLTIRSFATRDAAHGTVTVALPDAPDVVAARKKAEEPPTPPPPIPDPWTQPRRAPHDAPARVAAIYESVESLRAAVFGKDPFHVEDSCAWQADTVKFLAAARDRLGEGRPAPPVETLRFASRLARAIRTVEQFRTSKNVLLTGPVPDESLRRRAWANAHRDAMRPIERELDQVADAVREGRAPELADERWPARLVACLTACERHFDESVLEGTDRGANRDVAAAQWSRILDAGRAFAALGGLLEEPAPRDP